MANTLDVVAQNIRKDFDALIGLQVSGSLVLAQAGGPYRWLTNKTGAALTNGSVVAVDTANNSAVGLSDVLGSLRPFVVYVGNVSIADGTAGPFVAAGLVTVTAQGAIARGQYVYKSATTLAVADAGVAQTATAVPPAGTFGVAYSAAAAGVVVIEKWGATTPGTPAMSIVSGFIGITGSTTTYTCTGANTIQFYNPTSKSVEAIKTAQGALTNTITTAGPAANGRDTAAALDASAWLYLYYIHGAGQTDATISSNTAPPTGPALPANYTSWAFIGAYYLNGSTQFITTYTRGGWVDYQTYQLAVNAGASGTYASVSLTAFVPPHNITSLIRANGRAYITASTTRISELFLSYDGTNDAAHTRLVDVTVATDQELTVPLDFMNISQTIYYKIIGGTNPALDLYIRGYNVANGG